MRLFEIDAAGPFPSGSCDVTNAVTALVFRPLLECIIKRAPFLQISPGQPENFGEFSPIVGNEKPRPESSERTFRVFIPDDPQLLVAFLDPRHHRLNRPNPGLLSDLLHPFGDMRPHDAKVGAWDQVQRYRHCHPPKETHRNVRSVDAAFACVSTNPPFTVDET